MNVRQHFQTWYRITYGYNDKFSRTWSCMNYRRSEFFFRNMAKLIICICRIHLFCSQLRIFNILRMITNHLYFISTCLSINTNRCPTIILPGHALNRCTSCLYEYKHKAQSITCYTFLIPPSFVCKHKELYFKLLLSVLYESWYHH